ncbi:hypothetical protein [Halalkalicoccus salilacus]|uniref:hypothetical protein n=1 Tax=Halalkalicoccus salilacus TaxID=3117459 RepID=UPI00300F6240
MFSGFRSSDDADIDRTKGTWTEWLLLDGPRTLVAGITALVLLVVITLISGSELAPFRDLQPFFYIFVGLITGNLTIITVAVSISQLLLSKELKTPDELRSRMEGVVDYRKEIETATGRVPPVEPLGFLRFLFESTRQKAQRLGGLTISELDEDVYEEIDQVVSEVTNRADRMDALLQEADGSTFTVLSVTLTTNYARDIHRLRQLKSQHGDQLLPQTEELITDLVHRLQDIDIARQYFKAIYLREELAVLSRHLFYIGLASVATVIGGLFVFTEAQGVSVSSSSLTVIMPLIITIGLLPISLLFAFILRIATVSQRTAATLPFTTPRQEK